SPSEERQSLVAVRVEKVILPLGNRRQELCPSALHREIFVCVRLHVRDGVPRGPMRFNLPKETWLLAVSGLGKLKLPTVSRCHHDEPVPKLRNAVVRRAQYRIRRAVPALGTPVDVFDSA